MSTHPTLPAPLDLDALAAQFTGEQLLDQAELRLMNHLDGQYRELGGDLPDFPLVHRFTPGLYIREIHMPAGSVVVSCKHLYESPFVISKGDVSVWTEDTGWVRLRAPHTGITPAGTRRLLFNHTDVVWVGFLLNPEEDRDLVVLDQKYTHPRSHPRLRDALAAQLPQED